MRESFFSILFFITREKGKIIIYDINLCTGRGEDTPLWSFYDLEKRKGTPLCYYSIANKREKILFYIINSWSGREKRYSSMILI